MFFSAGVGKLFLFWPLSSWHPPVFFFLNYTSGSWARSSSPSSIIWYCIYRPKGGNGWVGNSSPASVAPAMSLTDLVTLVAGQGRTENRHPRHPVGGRTETRICRVKCTSAISLCLRTSLTARHVHTACKAIPNLAV